MRRGRLCRDCSGHVVGGSKTGAPESTPNASYLTPNLLAEESRQPGGLWFTRQLLKRHVRKRISNASPAGVSGSNGTVQFGEASQFTEDRREMQVSYMILS